jgi:hypothetical protein
VLVLFDHEIVMEFAVLVEGFMIGVIAAGTGLTRYMGLPVRLGVTVGSFPSESAIYTFPPLSTAICLTSHGYIAVLEFAFVPQPVPLITVSPANGSVELSFAAVISSRVRELRDAGKFAVC